MTTSNVGFALKIEAVEAVEAAAEAAEGHLKGLRLLQPLRLLSPTRYKF